MFSVYSSVKTKVKYSKTKRIIGTRFILKFKILSSKGTYCNEPAKKTHNIRVFIFVDNGKVTTNKSTPTSKIILGVELQAM
jgi:hypothetical protein